MSDAGRSAPAMSSAHGARPARVRVLHLAKFYPPERGGMERVLQVLCESTAVEVENVVLAAHTSRQTVHERVGGIAVTRAGRLLQCGSVTVCPSFPWWMIRTRAELAVVHEPNPLALVADWLTRSRLPLVVWFHADLVRPSWIYDWFYKPFLQRALARASCVVVSSPRLAASAAGLEGVRDKCVVVPFGVDATAFRRAAPVPAWLREFKARQPGPMALMVGRMVPYKGVDVLLRALAGSVVSAVVVGDGPELERHRVLARTSGLHDRVLFVGSIPDDELLAAYQACDFFVLPSVSRQETFGVVQLEAMACGKPVISTDLPTGVPWVNQHGETGIVVPPGDVEALRAAIETLAGDSGLRARLGAAARARVLQDFTVDQVKARILAVYRQVVDRPETRPAVPSSEAVASGPAT